MEHFLPSAGLQSINFGSHLLGMPREQIFKWESILFEMFISTIEFVHNGHDGNSLPFLGAPQDVRRRRCRLFVVAVEFIVSLTLEYINI